MKTRLFSLWLLLSVAVGLSAYDFEMDGLCYFITRSTAPYTVEVTGANLTIVKIPDTVTYDGVVYRVTSIGEKSFRGRTGITSVTIGNSVTSIGEDAFSGCIGLTSVTIGNSVTSIGESVFNGCNSLTSVTWNAKACSDFYLSNMNPFYCNAYYGDNKYLNFDIRSQITSFTFGDEVKHIPARLCCKMTNLTSVTIPNSVTSIGNEAFLGCTGLTSVTIGNSVTSIGEAAFSGCTGLTSVTIGNSVTSIKNGVFRGCNSLTSVTWNAKACSDFYNERNTPFYYNDNEYLKFDIRSQITSFTFGDSVQHIPAYLCEQMTNLTSVTIGNSVTSIGKNVFYGCNSLTSVTWNAKSCKNYDNILFYDSRSQITSFTFGDEVKHIPAWLCFEMTGLTSVTIPNSVTNIGNGAFSGCTGLTKVNYRGDVKGWLAIDMRSNPISYSHNLYINNELLTDLTIPEGITYISSNFAQCTSLVFVTIPNSVTSIGSSAFNGCTGLTSITIPNSVASIGSNAFSGCKNVETVVFGSGVETIGASAFSGCQSIYEMTIYATKVPTIQENTFAGVGTGATLRVPAGCAKKYKAHPYWGVFNIEEIPSEYTITVTCDPKQGQVTGGGTYIDGSKVSLTATPNNGYEFKQWSDGCTANPYSFLVEKDMTIEALFEPTTPIENVVAEEHIAPRKVFRDGQVYILRGGKIYTLTGVEVNL